MHNTMDLHLAINSQTGHWRNNLNLHQLGLEFARLTGFWMYIGNYPVFALGFERMGSIPL